MSDDGDAPTSGRFEGGFHVLPVRVYYEDTDAIGIVYHGNYLKWADRARTEMMRLLGTDHGGLLSESGVAFAVRRCAIEYDAPARLDDALEVRSRIVDIRGASLGFEQVVRRVRAGRPGATTPDNRATEGAARDLVRLSLTLFCLNRAGRPVRLPDPARTALAALGAI